MRVTDLARNRAARRGGGEAVLARAVACRESLGTREFYVSSADMTGLLQQVLDAIPRPVLSLNRPHADGRSVVHRIEWQGLVFTCVSARPLGVS